MTMAAPTMPASVTISRLIPDLPAMAGRPAAKERAGSSPRRGLAPYRSHCEEPGNEASLPMRLPEGDLTQRATARCRLEAAPAHAGHQRDQEDHDKDEEQDLGDRGRRAGDAEKAEGAGHERDDEKDDGPVQHDVTPARRAAPRRPVRDNRAPRALVPHSAPA